jgi:hypothetical protein
MSHLARVEEYEEEQTEDEDEFERRNGRGTAVMSTDDYIKSSSFQMLHPALD